jgi:trans-aconitate methyltransferase
MGFSAEWLALREPADHAARDAGLLMAAARAAGDSAVIVDLGCGTGSTRRAFGELLPHADWRMVDGDADLLVRAGERAIALT